MTSTVNFLFPAAPGITLEAHAVSFGDNHELLITDPPEYLSDIEGMAVMPPPSGAPNEKVFAGRDTHLLVGVDVCKWILFLQRALFWGHGLLLINW